MEITYNRDGGPEAWHAARNAAVAELVRAAFEGRLLPTKGVSRNVHDDAQAQWLFRMVRQPADLLASSDARLYGAAISCMHAAREDERRRIAKAISDGLRALLGTEFADLIYKIADLNDCVGRYETD